MRGAEFGAKPAILLGECFGRWGHARAVRNYWECLGPWGCMLGIASAEWGCTLGFACRGSRLGNLTDLSLELDLMLEAGLAPVALDTDLRSPFATRPVACKSAGKKRRK